jgi:hypothetical protein
MSLSLNKCTLDARLLPIEGVDLNPAYDVKYKEE